MRLDLKYILEHYSNNVDNRNNAFLSQLRILDILNKALQPLTKREIVKKYCEAYEDKIFQDTDLETCPELNNEVKKTRYREWLDDLVQSCLIFDKKGKRKLRGPKTGPLPNIYSLNPRVSLSVENIFNENADLNEEQAINTLKKWMAICNEFSFFPIKYETESLLEQIFTDFKSYPPIDWIQTTSPSLNLKSHKFEEEEYIENKLWIIAEAITIGEKISFTHTDFENKLHERKNFIPCIVREHRGKWYVVGIFSDSKKGKIFTYNLYTISDVEPEEILSRKEKKEQEEQKKAIKTIFKNSLGAFTKWQNSDAKNPKSDPNALWYATPLRISFKVRDGDKFDNIKYLKMDPIHSSQEPIGEPDNEGYVEVVLHCFPDSDLVREIRKIGLHNVKDIKCEWEGVITNDELPNLDKWVREF